MEMLSHVVGRSVFGKRTIIMSLFFITILQSVCLWLEAALKTLPAEFSDGRVNATQKQLTDFHKAVTR